MTTLEAFRCLPTGLFPLTPLFYGSQPKALVASQGYHVVSLPTFVWTEWLEGNVGDDAGGGNITTGDRCGGGQPWAPPLLIPGGGGGAKFAYKHVFKRFKDRLRVVEWLHI
jgi:hypothetical protein